MLCPLKILFQSVSELSALFSITQYTPAGLYYQPAFQGDGVHVEFLHQSQVMVHVLQTAQHLQQ